MAEVMLGEQYARVDRSSSPGYSGYESGYGRHDDFHAMCPGSRRVMF